MLDRGQLNDYVQLHLKEGNYYVTKEAGLAILEVIRTSYPLKFEQHYSVTPSGVTLAKVQGASYPMKLTYAYDCVSISAANIADLFLVNSNTEKINSGV